MGDEADYLESQSDGFEGCVHTCKRCGKQNLKWNEGPPWRLCDELGNIHVCEKKKAKKK